MDYIIISTTGNATTFGNLTIARGNPAGVSSSTRGVFGGGATSLSASDTSSVMDYITISTTGNATTFGNLTVSRNVPAGVSSGSRGVFGGGVNTSGSNVSVMDYITISTTGNATNFGNLTVARSAAGGVSGS